MYWNTICAPEHISEYPWHFTQNGGSVHVSVYKQISSYLCFFLCLPTHIPATTAARMIIPIDNTPPTPPVIAPVFRKLPECGPAVVGLTQPVSDVDELISTGQLGSTFTLLPWTITDVCPSPTHCSMYDNTCAQSWLPCSSARYKTTCWSLVQRKCSVLIWFTAKEHWHLELTADITELVMSASFSLVFWNCEWQKHNLQKHSPNCFVTATT